MAKISVADVPVTPYENDGETSPIYRRTLEKIIPTSSEQGNTRERLPSLPSNVTHLSLLVSRVSGEVERPRF